MESRTVFCVGCGVGMGVHDAYCERCGTPAETDVEFQESAAPPLPIVALIPDDATSIDVDPTQPKRSRTPVLVGAITLCVVAIAVGLIASNSSDSTTSAVTAISATVSAARTTVANTSTTLSTVASSAPPSMAPSTSVAPPTVTVSESSLPSGDLRTVCVRWNIDFAALRSAPDLDAELLGKIPAGSCDAKSFNYETARGNGFDWVHVLWNGIDGWTAVDNLDPEYCDC